MPLMEETGISFGDVVELECGDDRQELRERMPLSDVILDMVAEHLPNPLGVQPRCIPTVWRDSSESDLARQMREVDDDGEAVFMATGISMGPHAGEIVAGRLSPRIVRKGQELYVSGTTGKNRVQSAGVFMSGEREELDRGVPAGDIATVTKLRDTIAGSTVSSVEMTPFKSIEHISRPVTTESVEAGRMDDLSKLIQAPQQVVEEDPTIRIEINEDTGKRLIFGQDELHLEVITQRIRDNQGIPVRTGEPTVVYREQVQGESHEVGDVSPNHHNKFYITTEPLSQDIVDSIKLGEISMDMPELERREALQEADMDKDTSQDVEYTHGANILIDDTKGIQHLNETTELVIEDLEEAFGDDPLTAEPVQGTLLCLHDARLHEGTIRRGLAQVIPATHDAVHRALIASQVKLLGPVQNVRIDVPSEYVGSASSEIRDRHGHVDDMYREGDLMVIEGITPAEEIVGFSSDICFATEGRASWNTEGTGFRVLSDGLQREKIIGIRERKGMKLEPSQAIDYV